MHPSDMKVRATPLPTPLRFAGPTTVGRVEYNNGHVAIEVVGGDDANEERVLVRFDSVEALRVMDERDLLEYWPACSGSDWLFEVHSGGWLTQESQRSTNSIPDFYHDLKEYLIGGQCECVSVLSAHPPTIEILRSESG